MHLDLPSLETSFDLVAPRGDELMDDLLRATCSPPRPASGRCSPAPTCLARSGMLLGALVLLRKSLRDLDRDRPRAAARWAPATSRYGARPEHYPVVGEVLIAAMAEIAGDDWRPEYAAAWATAYGIVSANDRSRAAAERRGTGVAA